MKIKVKYSNGKLLSNNKEIILNNVADIHEIIENEPNALTTKLFFGIVKDGDGERGIVCVIPVRSLVDNDVIYLYIWDKHKKYWHRLDKFTETRTIFDSYDECVDFFMESECGVSDVKETEKTIADELLDEVNEKIREDNERKNFDELCERVKKIEEYRKLTAKIEMVKVALKNDERDYKDACNDYDKSFDEYCKISRDLEHKQAFLETVKKVKEQREKIFEELDNRRAELDGEIKENGCDVGAIWDDFLRQCFGE